MPSRDKLQVMISRLSALGKSLHSVANRTADKEDDPVYVHLLPVVSCLDALERSATLKLL